MVLRRQAFAGHTLSVMAFPGATGAALIGLPTALGLLPRVRGRGADDRRGAGPAGTRATAARPPTIGTVQAVGLAAGLPVPVAQPRRARRAPRRSCSAPSSASASSQVAGAAGGRARRGRWLLARVLRGRCCSRPSTARSRAPRGVPVRALDARLPADPRRWPSPPRARSPGRCSCSRCSSRRRPPPSS